MTKNITQNIRNGEINISIYIIEKKQEVSTVFYVTIKKIILKKINNK